MGKLTLTEKEKIEEYIDEMEKEYIAESKQALTPNDKEDALEKLFEAFPEDVPLRYKYKQLVELSKQLAAIAVKVNDMYAEMLSEYSFVKLSYSDRCEKLIGDIEKEAIDRYLLIREKQKKLKKLKRDLWLTNISDQAVNILKDTRIVLYPESEEE